MNRTLVPLLIVASSVLVAPSANAKAAGISWVRAYSSASAKAKSTGKLIMIDFYTDWCGWCKKLDADTYPAPEVVKESSNFIPIKLNAEKDPEGVRLAKKFGVNGYPTILFLDGDEHLAYKVVGYEPAKDFAASMAKAATIRRDSKKYQTALKANPSDYDALTGYASILASTGDLDKASKLLDQAAASATTENKGKLLDGYNALGDGYQNGNQFPQAIASFQNSLDPAFPKQAAYARISIAVCYYSSQQPAKAVPYLQDLLKMGSEADQYRKDAQSLLDTINKPAPPAKG